MSLKSWINQYYRVPAENLKGATALKSAQHSLQKWKGLLPDAMKKHKVKKSHSRIGENFYWDDPTFGIDDKSCALCVNYLDTSDDGRNCDRCPIVKATGERCDVQSSYNIWYDTGYAKPMIKTLENTIIWIKENNYRG